MNSPIGSLLWLLPMLAMVGCSESPLYSSCESNSDCVSSADACFVIARDDGRAPMCSLYCEVDSDCPGDAKCYELVGDPLSNRVCYQACDADIDCAPGFVCEDAISGGVDRQDVCLPL